MADQPVHSHAEDLACVEVVEIVTDYLEGALPAAEALRLERHLATCPGCTEYLEQLRAIAGSLERRHRRLLPARAARRSDRRLPPACATAERVRNAPHSRRNREVTARTDKRTRTASSHSGRRGASGSGSP